MSKKQVLSKFTILCWAAFIAILGRRRPVGRGRDTPEWLFVKLAIFWIKFQWRNKTLPREGEHNQIRIVFSSVPRYAPKYRGIQKSKGICPRWVSRGRKGTQQSFTFFYISPIFSICSYSNPTRDWVARKALVSIETICSIREKVYLVAHEI